MSAPAILPPADAGPAFRAAAERHGVRFAHLRIAGRAFRLEATGDLLDVVQPTFAHLLADEPAPPDALLFRLWEDEVPHPAWDPTGPEAQRTPDGTFVARGGRHAPAHLERFQPTVGIEHWAEPAGDRRGTATVLHPAGRATAAWAVHEGLRLLHAGAVAHDGTAALLVGPSGAGKTTAALAAARRGFAQLGDDQVLVDVAARRVHSLCATSAITADTLARADPAPPEVLGLALTGKAIVALSSWGSLVPSAPLGALVLLEPEDRTAGGATTSRAGPRPVRPVEAAKALVTATLHPGLGRAVVADWFADALALARAVPAFGVARGWDLDRMVADVEEAVSRGRARPSAPGT